MTTEVSTCQCDVSGTKETAKERILAGPCLASLPLILNTLVKPGLRVGPVTLHGFGGDAERLSHFLVLQAREEPHLDDLGLDWILSRQVVQRFMDLEQFILFRLRYELGFLEADALLTAAVAKPPFTPDVFHL